LLEQLPPEQVRAVVAHELAHIRNRDVLVSSIAAMIAGAVSAIANVLQFSFFFGGHDDDDAGPLGWLGTIATLMLAPLAATARPRSSRPIRRSASGSAGCAATTRR
jgi:heat shock protein HtpX